MKTIFIVDDKESNRIAAKSALSDKYRTFALPSASAMFVILKKIEPDLILLDIDMPDMDGFEAMRILKADEKYKSIPVIFLTSINDAQAEIQGFDMGALDFIKKPFSPPVLIKRVETHIETDWLIKKSLKAVRDIHNTTISVISEMVENRDQVTGGHIRRTQKYLDIIIQEMVRSGTYAEEISQWNITILLPSAQLHDVGKIAISDMILNKPGQLTEEEFEVVKTHSLEGERIIDHIINETEDDGFLQHAKRFAGYHHEWWDGSGYPRGLSGLDIPLEGRILAVVDVYDALVSKRPYKEPFTHEKAVEIMKSENGTHFDPAIFDCFLNVEERFAGKL